MADSKKFTYRVNTKTPDEVKEWLDSKPDGVSSPDFINSAILVALAKDENSDVDIDTVMTRLQEMTANPTSAGKGGGSSVSPDELAQAVSSVIEDDGKRTRQRVEEAIGGIGDAVEQAIGERLDRMSEAVAQSGGDATAGLAMSPEDISQTVSQAVSQGMSGISLDGSLDGVAESIREDGDRTREAVSEVAGAVSGVDEKVSTILEAIQSAGGDAGEALGTEATGDDDDPDIIKDGSLTEEDLDFAVRRLKDTVRTDGQKTRNALAQKIDAIASEMPQPEAPQPSVSLEQMQAMFDELREGNKAMLAAVEKHMEEGGSQSQGSKDIVFDEATTVFFKRIHNSVSSILIRVDAMQAQLDHIQKIVERNGSNIRTIARGADSDSDKIVIPGRPQYGDATDFADAPMVEEMPDEPLAIAWDDEQEPSGAVGGINFGMPDEEAPTAQDASDGISEDVAYTEPRKPYVPGAEPSPTRDDVLMSLLGDNRPSHDGDASGQDGDTTPADDEGRGNEASGDAVGDAGAAAEATKDDAQPARKPRVTVPRRRYQHGIRGASHDETTSDGATTTPSQDGGDDRGASSVMDDFDDIIGKMDYDSVGDGNADPDGLLADTLKNLLG